MNVIGGRFLVKKTYIPNVVPTISPYQYHTSNKWSDSDIYEGELFINMHDNRFWFRSSKNQIIELPVLDVDTLKIDDKYLPDMYGKLNYKGIYNGELNLPILGDYYIINSSCIINGLEYSIGDFIVYNGNFWDKIDNNNKIIHSSDIIIDGDKTLNDIINDIYLKIPSNNILIIDKGNEILKVDSKNISYMNNQVYHSSNSNNENIDWKANKLSAKELKVDNIYTDYLNTNKVETNDIVTKNIRTDVINTENLTTKVLNVKSGVLSFSDKSIFLSANANGVLLNHLTNNIFEYKSLNKEIIFNNKIKYSKKFNFISELDIVNKEYVDEEINKTDNIDVDNLEDNLYLLRLNIKYINIDIIKKNEFTILVDNIQKSNNSHLVTMCIESKVEKFNIYIKNGNDTIFTLNDNGFVTLYFNSKNKKWYLKN